MLEKLVYVVIGLMIYFLVHQFIKMRRKRIYRQHYQQTVTRIPRPQKHVNARHRKVEHEEDDNEEIEARPVVVITDVDNLFNENNNEEPDEITDYGSESDDD